jgi:3-methylcrotonyl-CoA carboxylase alpha subunit
MRLYAEDPEQNFLPSTGKVTRFIKPEGPGIRVDSGIESGDEITQFYDPMIAKMIAYGEDRASAIERMQRALEQTAVFGVKTNAPLLYSIATHPAFEEGRTHTSFLAEHALIGNHAGQQHLPGEVLVAGALSEIAGDVRLNSDGHAQPSYSAPTSPWSTVGPWRMIGEARRVIFSYQGKEYSVAIRPTGDGSGEWSVQVDNQPAENITCVFGNDDLVLLRRRAEQVQTYVQHVENETQVSLHGRMYRLEERQPPNVDTAVRESNPAHAQKVLTAPMAGTIVKVQVHEGDSVEQRQVLVILSAMKMEHTIVAPYAGKVRRVHYQEGAVVKGGAVLVEME